MSDPPNNEQPTPCFEEALGELERAVRRLEDGDLDLSDALDCFEHGIRQLKHCYRLLEEAERRVELLTGVDAEGEPLTEPLSDEEMSLEEKQTARGRRRSHTTRRPRPATPAPGDVDDPEGLF